MPGQNREVAPGEEGEMNLIKGMTTEYTVINSAPDPSCSEHQP